MTKIVVSDDVELETTPVFDAYWYFAVERQRIFFRRLMGKGGDLTNDAVLQKFKFTNAYRASDRVSQFLLRSVIYKEGAPVDANNIFFRTILFKIFNKIETWKTLESELGEISVENYDFDSYEKLLAAIRTTGNSIYSAAYIMPSAGSVFGEKHKHGNHLRLIEYMLNREYPKRIMECVRMEQAYNLLLATPSIGSFLAYQFITDLNYSDLTDFSEREFVVAGPGALDGISKCFVNTKGIKPEKIIRHMTEKQTHYFENYSLQFDDLWGRPLQLIDCQNLFCEISKYARVAFPEAIGHSKRTRIKQKYASYKSAEIPWYPPKWGINDRIGFENYRVVGPEIDSTVQKTFL